MADIITLETAAPALEGRTIEAVTEEILELKNTAGGAILAIGQRLTEAKNMLPHGEWLPWLNERVEFSERAAQNFMRLAREWSNPQTLADLGASKALTLLALPPAEREEFMAAVHDVDGREKTVVDMSARELKQAIRARDEALAAQKAAEEARDKLSADLTLTQGLLEGKTAELEVLKSRPVEVAVQVDQEAVNKARAEGAAEAKKELDKSEKARAKAEGAQKAAEEARQKAEEELARVRAQLDAAQKSEKKAALAVDKEIAAFEVCFGQAQSLANQMHGLLLKARGRGDTAAANLQQAMLALADAIRRAAE